MFALPLLMAIVPYVNPTVDTVESVEVNTLYDKDTANETFTQVFWRGEDGQIIAYRMVGWGGPKGTLPIRNHTTNRWECTWIDGPILRRVVARTYSRTHTIYDPEAYERNNVLPADKRAGLTEPVPALTTKPKPTGPK